MSTSMESKVIDAIFARLLGAYGKQFTDLYAQVDPAAVREAWARELRPYFGRKEAIAWALENLPDRCPTAPQFRNLCRQAPAPAAPRLPEPVADPGRMRREMAKLNEIIRSPIKTASERLLERIESDPRLVSPTVRAMATFVRRGDR